MTTSSAPAAPVRRSRTALVGGYAARHAGGARPGTTPPGCGPASLMASVCWPLAQRWTMQGGSPQNRHSRAGGNPGPRRRHMRMLTWPRARTWVPACAGTTGIGRGPTSCVANKARAIEQTLHVQGRSMRNRHTRAGANPGPRRRHMRMLTWPRARTWVPACAGTTGIGRGPTSCVANKAWAVEQTLRVQGRSMKNRHSRAGANPGLHARPRSHVQLAAQRTGLPACTRTTGARHAPAPSRPLRSPRQQPGSPGGMPATIKKAPTRPRTDAHPAGQAARSGAARHP